MKMVFAVVCGQRIPPAAERKGCAADAVGTAADRCAEVFIVPLVFCGPAVAEQYVDRRSVGRGNGQAHGGCAVVGHRQSEDTVVSVKSCAGRPSASLPKGVCLHISIITAFAQRKRSPYEIQVCKKRMASTFPAKTKMYGLVLADVHCRPMLPAHICDAYP